MFPIETFENRVLLSTSLTFTTAAPMPIPRAEGGSFVADGKMFAFGGFIGSKLQISTEMDAYDPTTNKWTRVADCPVKVNDDPVAVDPVTDTAWITGFFLNDGFHPSGLTYAYNVKTNTWTQGPSLPETIGAGGMAVVGRELHYWGGRDMNNIGTTAHYRLNLDDVAAGWVKDTPIPLTTNHVATATVNGQIYSIGGIINKEETTSNETNVWRYDPSTRQWTAMAPIPVGTGHIASAAAVYGNDIIIAGGEINGSKDIMTEAVREYDTVTNTWTQIGNLPAPRQSSLVTAIGNELIVSGGNQYTAPYAVANTWVAQLAPPATGSITGNIFNDYNGDAIRESNEPALNGWGVFLDINHNGVYDPGVDVRTMSDANGNYTFSNLAPGSYSVMQDAVTGWARSTPTTLPDVVTVTSGNTTTVNFGEHQAGIFGKVFYDANNNGVFDAGDTALASWGVFIDVNDNGVYDPGTDIRVNTDANGDFAFVNLPPGTYHINERIPTGWTRKVPSVAGYTITLTAGQIVTGKNIDYNHR
jgi:N-acetylneuraminic acid mutarotase